MGITVNKNSLSNIVTDDLFIRWDFANASSYPVDLGNSVYIYVNNVYYPKDKFINDTTSKVEGPDINGLYSEWDYNDSQGQIKFSNIVEENPSYIGLGQSGMYTPSPPLTYVGGYNTFFSSVTSSYWQNYLPDFNPSFASWDPESSFGNTDIESFTFSVLMRLPDFDNFVEPTWADYPVTSIIGNLASSINGFSTPIEVRIGQNGSQITLEYCLLISNNISGTTYRGRHGDLNAFTQFSENVYVREFKLDITDYINENEWFVLTLSCYYGNHSPGNSISNNFVKCYINDQYIGNNPFNFDVYSPFVKPNNYFKNSNLDGGAQTTDVSTILSYRKVLTDTQITNNYNALKGRFNI